MLAPFRVTSASGSSSLRPIRARRRDVASTRAAAAPAAVSLPLPRQTGYMDLPRFVGSRIQRERH
jgi:hypothetical protein